jgi:hypothetical protein
MGGGKHLASSLIQSKKVVMISKACSVASLGGRSEDAVGLKFENSVIYP